MNTTGTASLMEEKKVEHQDVRILIIDDEPMMADSLKQNLMEEGYSVDTAASGAEAIELFDQGGHHLAICDLQLPDMDGLEVMRHMKDARPTTEVIVVTVTRARVRPAPKLRRGRDPDRSRPAPS